MPMTRDEVLSRRFTQPPEAEKRDSADDIARQVDEYLRRGGRIQQVAIGVSGFEVKPLATAAHQRSASAGRTQQHRTNGKLSLTAAARMAGMSLVEFRTLVFSGKGPKAFAQGHTFRFEERAVREWLQRREQIERDLVEAMTNLRPRASA